MKFSIFIISILLLSSMFGCANKAQKSGDEEMAEQSSEVSDALLEDSVDGEQISLTDVEDDLLLEDTDSLLSDTSLSSGSDLVAENATGGTNDASMLDDAELLKDDLNTTEFTNVQPAILANTSGEMKSYTVKRNDTLMLVAWNIYGDYSRWREISEMNGGVKSLKEGMALSYKAPETEFSYRPDGDPYLIIRGDTLGLISNKVYNTKSKWKVIYDNNRPLIKDPNLIFAGFTIYYPTNRGVAGE